MIGVTFGVWDLLHKGHVEFLNKCIEYLDITTTDYKRQLIVGVAGDSTTEEDKKQRPVINETDRCYMLEELRVVNIAEIYHGLNFIPLLRKYRPDVLFVGEQWGKEQRHIDAENWMKARRCTVIRVPRTEGISTTEIKNKILIANNCKDFSKNFTTYSE